MYSTLRREIEKKTFQLILDELNGTPKPPTNPFTRDRLVFDYTSVHQKYHASQNPGDTIVLYKGALRGYEPTGFLSNALRRGFPGHVVEIKQIVESASDDKVFELFDAHTSYYLYTALLSATFNPERAQVFASTYPFARKKEDKTIYQLRIQAKRCVINCYDERRDKEVFILGAIFPEEISAVKILNDNMHSELIDTFEGVTIVRDFPNPESDNKQVKDPKNWRYFSR